MDLTFLFRFNFSDKHLYKNEKPYSKIINFLSENNVHLIPSQSDKAKKVYRCELEMPVFSKFN